MNALLAAVAVVRVVGIAMVTNQVPNDPGIHIILPAIHGPMDPNMNLQAQPISQRFPINPKPAPTVEAHKAVLIFRACNLVAAPGWKVETLPGFPDVRYVDLAGQVLQFVGNKSNPSATLAGLKLPHLQFDPVNCKQLTELSAGYQWPYRNVNAMIDVPAGQLKACRATSSANASRIDTLLTMNYDTFFIASTGVMNSYKELRLRNCPNDDLQVVVYHGPWRVFEGKPGPASGSAADGAPHFQAYYWMTSTNAGGCSAPAAVDPGCQITTPWLRAGVGKNEQPPEVTQVDFECSNTQWP